MFLRSERGGGRGLESFPVEGAEGAGHDGCNREQAEGREGAQHEREQQEQRQPSGPRLGGPSAASSGIDTDPFEGGAERRSLSDVVGHHPQQRTSGLTPAGLELPDGGEERRTSGHGPAGIVEIALERLGRPASHDRKRSGNREPGTRRQDEEVDQVGDVALDGPSWLGPALRADAAPPSGDGEGGRSHEGKDGVEERCSGEDGNADTDAPVGHGIGVRTGPRSHPPAEP